MMFARFAAYKSKQAGFTLIEMLAVITIMSLLLGISLPLLRGPPDRLRLAEGIKRVKNVMVLTRAMAIARNNDGVVVIDTATGTVHASSTTTRLGDLRAELVIADAERRSTSSGAIRFFADGSSTGGTVTLRLGRWRSKISVDWMTGRVSVDEADNVL